MKGFKRGIIPKGQDPGLLLICKKCGFKNYYYGSARPEKNMKCYGCKTKRKSKKTKKACLKTTFKVKRNPMIVKRN